AAPAPPASLTGRAVDSLPRRLELSSRLLFVLSGPLIGAGAMCVIGGVVAAEDVAARLLERLLAEIDAETLAGLPPDFLTPSTVQRAAFALGAGLVTLGLAQLVTAVALRHGRRWSYAAAVVGSLFVAFTAGGTALFMLVTTSAQPQAAVLLAIGAVALGSFALLYAAIAALTGAGRRELETAGRRRASADESAGTPGHDEPEASIG
ncbi:MAG: hypothetical protein ACRDFR_08590, partial [Candidatus Limnocylindria bacterium]